MEITEKDKRETLRIDQIITKIDKIDEDYIKKEMDIIFNQQPFLISLIMGYSLDLKPEELEEMMKITLIIWEYFKEKEKIKKKKVTENKFETIQKRNIHLIKYFEGEVGKADKSKLLESDLSHLSSKALLAGIFLRFNTQYALTRIKTETRGILLIGIKSLIESLEEIEKS